ncbi:unnamed protein product [Ilex paraguariensis]|uniref:UBE2O-like tandem tSH3-B domain-containing protein n=1 Tax=Ilex paraguariensis TaxID=185542 RepID=A0ABC8QPU2_9AQUA
MVSNSFLTLPFHVFIRWKLNKPLDTPKVEEPTTGNDKAALNIGCQESSSKRNANSECKPDEFVRNLQPVACIYRQDDVRSNSTGKIVLVPELAGDSDSDGSITDDEDEDDENANDDDETGPNEVDGWDGKRNDDGSTDRSRVGGNYKSSLLPADQVTVLEMDESETSHKIDDVTVVDGGFLHGDYVAFASHPTGQIGLVVDVNISVDLLAADGSVLKDVSSKDLKCVRDFTVGDVVVLGPWVGRIQDVVDNVTVLFHDSSVCEVMKADPLHLKPVRKNIVQDVHFPYYPGQRVKTSSSSVFKNNNAVVRIKCHPQVVPLLSSSLVLQWGKKWLRIEGGKSRVWARLFSG